MREQCLAHCILVSVGSCKFCPGLDDPRSLARSLTESSSQVQGLLSTVVGYQQRLEGALVAFTMGRIGSMSGALTYVAVLAGGWALAGLSSRAGRQRQTLVVTLLACALSERLLLRHLGPHFELDPQSQKVPSLVPMWNLLLRGAA